LVESPSKGKIPAPGIKPRKSAEEEEDGFEPKRFRSGIIKLQQIKPQVKPTDGYQSDEEDGGTDIF